MAERKILIRAFAGLGAILRAVVTALGTERNATALPPQALTEWEDLLQKAYEQNGWFTHQQVLHAFNQWSGLLREPMLENWLKAYPENNPKPLTVALVLAGNIPMVGFHDFLSVLITGNRALVKCPSNDRLLLPFLADRLCKLEPALADRISFTEGTLEGFDAVIATGSNNTSRYFEHYFSSRPHIIRKNRNTVAVLTGNESESELLGVAEDVFRYFGMGCRSVSKLFVPEGYDFAPLFEAFYVYRHLIDHQKYANNYDYNKAVFLMSGADMLDNGFILLKQDAGLGSPIGTLFYETYTGREALARRLQADVEALQCVVGPAEIPGAIPFGSSQHPGLSDYADGVDTVDFLLKNAVI